MLSLNKSLPKISLIVLLIISVAVGLFFYIGGGSNENIYVGDETIPIPKFTDLLLYWSYILMFLSVIITLLIQLISFVKKLKEEPKAGGKSLLIFLGMIVVIGGSFFLGSGEKMDIIGYEGTDNVGFWAQFTDMCVYSIYILFAGAVLAIVGTSIYKLIKK